MFVVAERFLRCGSISVLKHTMSISAPKLEVSIGPESLVSTGCQQSSSQRTNDVGLQTSSGSNTSDDGDQLSNEPKKTEGDAQLEPEAGELVDTSLSSTVTTAGDSQPAALVPDEQTAGAGDACNVTPPGSSSAVTDAQKEPADVDQAESQRHSEDRSSRDGEQSDGVHEAAAAVRNVDNDTGGRSSCDTDSAAAVSCDEAVDQGESTHHGGNKSSPRSADDVETADVRESEEARQDLDDDTDVKLPCGRDDVTSFADFEHITESLCHTSSPQRTVDDDVLKTEPVAESTRGDAGVELSDDGDAAARSSELEHITGQMSTNDQTLTGADTVAVESVSSEPCVDINSIADVPVVHSDNEADTLTVSTEEEAAVMVLVSGIPHGLEEIVEMYLESKKKGGGTIESFKYNRQSGSALVLFADNAGDPLLMSCSV